MGNKRNDPQPSKLRVESSNLSWPFLFNNITTYRLGEHLPNPAQMLTFCRAIDDHPLGVTRG